MSGLSIDKPEGDLRSGWSATVDDYAIAGGWAESGQILVVGDTAGSVHAFEGTSGKVAWSRAHVHEGGLLCLAVHPREPVFATAGQDGRLLLWSMADGQVRHETDVGRDWVETMAWSPDGRRLAISCGRIACVFGKDGSELWRSQPHPSTVRAIAWSGSDELATASYGQVAFFDAATGESRQTLGWTGSLVSMVLSPDGGIVACGSQDNSVHFWRRTTAEDSMMSGYPGKPSALSFDASGTLLATGGGPVVTVWSFEGRGPEGTVPGHLSLHTRAITTLAFANRGMRLASGARDGAVGVWSLGPNGMGDLTGVGLSSGPVAELYWRPDGRGLAALDAHGGVTVWRVAR